MATYNLMVNTTIIATFSGRPAHYSATGVGYNLTTKRFFWITGKDSVGLSLSAAGTTAGFELTTITNQYNYWCLIFPSSYSDILMEYADANTYWSFTKTPSNPAYSKNSIDLTTTYDTNVTHNNYFGDDSGTYPITVTPFNMTEITITKDFTNLLTGQTYCDKDIQISAPLQNKSVYNVTDSTTLRADDGFYGLESAYFSVSKETKTVTPTTSSQTVTPSSGKVLSSVTVNAAPLDAAKTVTAGTAATTVNPTGSNIGLKSVTINPTPSSAKTATPTKETQTVSPDSGKLLSGVTVNPIPDEYIIPSGTKDIMANGTTDVTSFASVNVNVPSPDLSDATATAGKILLGFTAYTGAGKITGTIPTYDGSLRPDSVMPVKGDLITIESKQYRVLKINKTTAEVLAMYDSTTSQEFNSSTNTYANSSLDVYLSQTFYNSLSTSMQNAIVAKAFQQDSWKWEGGSSAIANYAGTYQTTNNYTFSLMSTTFGTSISRKCYALSCQDVIDYLEVTTSMGSADTTLTSENVWRMFWNQTTFPGSTYPWLRSAYSVDTSLAFRVSGYAGLLNYGRVINANAVRPAFQIDLSKVEFTK